MKTETWEDRVRGKRRNLAFNRRLNWISRRLLYVFPFFIGLNLCANHLVSVVSLVFVWFLAWQAREMSAHSAKWITADLESIARDFENITRSEQEAADAKR